MEVKTIVVDQNIISYLYNKGNSDSFFVFLHGRGRNKMDWKDYFSVLQDKGLGFLAIDFPGFGNSSNPKGARGVEEYSQIVIDCIEKLNISYPVSLVCHSFGGRVGIYLTANYPDKIRNLFLAAPGGIEKSLSSTKKTIITVGKKIFSLNIFQPIKKKLIQSIGSNDYLGSGLLKDTFVKVVNQDLTYLLSKISQQVFLYWGDEDDQILSWQIEYLKTNIKNLVYCQYSKVGHDVHIEKKDEILNDILNNVSN